MKAIVVFFVIINDLIWLFASIGSFNSFVKGIVPPPIKPGVPQIIGTLVLLVMNLVVLFYILSIKGEQGVRPTEAKMKKFFIGLGWFVIIYLVSSFLIGMIVGALAGGSTTTTAPSYEARRLAGIEFAHKYGLWVFLGSGLAAIAGTATGFLPFTKDEK